LLTFSDSAAGFFGFGPHYVATAGINLLPPSSVADDWAEALGKITQWRIKRGELARKVHISFHLPPRAQVLAQEVRDLVHMQLLADGLPAALQGIRVETYITDDDGDCLLDVIINPDGTVERRIERMPKLAE
jgi:hypothetical protein